MEQLLHQEILKIIPILQKTKQLKSIIIDNFILSLESNKKLDLKKLKLIKGVSYKIQSQKITVTIAINKL